MSNDPLDQIVLLAIQDGSFPDPIEVGQVYERVDHLLRDGTRMKFRGQQDHTRIRITRIPSGRARTIRYVKVDPRPMGNGRPDRQEKAITLHGLVRNYALVERPTNVERMRTHALDDKDGQPS